MKSSKNETIKLIEKSKESYSRGQYAKAEYLIKKALYLSEQEGNEADVASCMHNLGTILTSMGRYSEALARTPRAGRAVGA